MNSNSTVSVHNSSGLCSNEATLPDVSVPMVDTYISSLSPKELKAYLIAKSHLDMSFDVEKSIGYKQFVQKKNDSTK